MQRLQELPAMIYTMQRSNNTNYTFNTSARIALHTLRNATANTPHIGQVQVGNRHDYIVYTHA